MDTKVFSAYNEASDRVLNPRIIVVDAEREPIKVLKILMGGLAPDARSGIWLTHFQGVPAARAASSFDLIYLDDQHRVLHAVEISKHSEFKPFKGQPASALILQPKTIARSKTFSGDRIALNPAENRSAESETTATPRRTERFPARIVSAFAAKTFNVPSDNGSDSRSSPTPVSGSLMKSGRLAAGSILGLGLSTPPTVAQPEATGQQTNDGKVVPISAAHVPLPEPDLVDTQNETSQSELSSSIPAALPAIAIPASAIEQTLVTHSFPSTSITELEKATASILSSIADEPLVLPKSDSASHARAETSAAKQLPKKHETPIIVKSESVSQTQTVPSTDQFPSKHEPRILTKTGSSGKQRVEGQLVRDEGSREPLSKKHEMPNLAKPESLSRTQTVSSTDQLPAKDQPQTLTKADSSGERPVEGQLILDEGGREPSLAKRVLSWLYADLDPERVEKSRRSRRRAPRIAVPGLVGYYFAGGPATPHEIRNISVMGFYMVTDQRWMPGTVIRVTLQMLQSDGEDPPDSITVLSRVVNWGRDGGGFEFIYPGFVD